MKKRIHFLLILPMLLGLLTGIAANAVATETLPADDPTVSETFSATEPAETSETTESTESDEAAPTETEAQPTVPEKILIDTVKVSFSKPAAGVIAALPAVPGDAHYAVDTANSWWYRFNIAPPVMGPGETFSPGTSYSLALTLIPAEGYAFHTGTQLYLNGKAVTPSVVSANSLAYYSDAWHIGYAVARADILFTTPKVGEAAQLPTVPDEGYHIKSDGTYWKNETTGKILSPGDVFEAGCSYRLYLSVGSDLTSLFDDKTTLYLTRATGGSPAYITEEAQITSRTDTVIQSRSAVFSLPGGKGETDKPVNNGNTDTQPTENTETQPQKETTEPQVTEESIEGLPSEESTEIPPEATVPFSGEETAAPEGISDETTGNHAANTGLYLTAAGIGIAALLGFGIFTWKKKRS